MFKVTDPGVNYLKISSQHGIEKKSFSNVWREGDEKRERERERKMPKEKLLKDAQFVFRRRTCLNISCPWCGLFFSAITVCEQVVFGNKVYND